MYEIIRVGKQGLDGFISELGSMVAEAIMDMEREERSGPEYYPSQIGLYKWAYQEGSVYLAVKAIAANPTADLVASSCQIS